MRPQPRRTLQKAVMRSEDIPVLEDRVSSPALSIHKCLQPHTARLPLEGGSAQCSALCGLRSQALQEPLSAAVDPQCPALQAW